MIPHEPTGRRHSRQLWQPPLQVPGPQHRNLAFHLLPEKRLHSLQRWQAAAVANRMLESMQQQRMTPCWQHQGAALPNVFYFSFALFLLLNIFSHLLELERGNSPCPSLFLQQELKERGAKENLILLNLPVEDLSVNCQALLPRVVPQKRL